MHRTRSHQTKFVDTLLKRWGNRKSVQLSKCVKFANIQRVILALSETQRLADQIDALTPVGQV